LRDSEESETTDNVMETWPHRCFTSLIEETLGRHNSLPDYQLLNYPCGLAEMKKILF